MVRDLMACREHTYTVRTMPTGNHNEGLAGAAIGGVGAFELVFHTHLPLTERVTLSALAIVPGAAIGVGLFLGGVGALLYALLYALPWLYRRAFRPELPRGTAPWHIIAVWREAGTNGISFDQPPRAKPNVL